VSLDVDKLVADALSSARAARVDSIVGRAALLGKLEAQRDELAAQVAKLEALNTADAADVATIDAKAAAIGAVSADVKP
jgi:hypothetical protein